MESSGSRVLQSSIERSRLPFFLGALVLLVCLLAYGVALNGPLFFDDEPNLLANQQVQIDGLTYDDWRAAVLSSYSSILMRPVAMLTFAVNHAAAGAFTPFSLKATNVAIHVGIGALLFLFALVVLQAPALRTHRLNPHQRRLVALIAASIWLLHPIHVSTVLYAVQRMAQLSTMFTLAGLLVFTHYRLRWASSGAGPGEVLAALLWLGLLAVFAVLSKENGALLPWLIVVIEVTLFRGVWGGKRRTPLVWCGWLLLLLPVLLVVALYLVAPEILQGRYGGREFTLPERLLTQGRALWQYLSWMLVPNIMSMGFFHDDFLISSSLWAPFTTFFSMLAWLVVLSAAAIWHRRYPLIAFALFFYLVAHTMESTVLPLEMVFEHRNYLPSMGFAVLAGVGILRCVSRFDRLRLRTVVGGVLCLLVALLFVRTTAWSDEESLARYNVINHPQSPRANFFYANVLFKRFQRAQALGLDADQQRALAVTSRGYFERMRSLDERNFSALVMLYQLDTLYFPALAQENDWLGVMTELAKTRRLQSSDRTALGALVNFSLKPAMKPERDRVAALLDLLVERYPHKANIVGFQYRFIMATAPAQKASLFPLLLRAQARNTDSPRMSAYLVQYHGTDDSASTYEALREWMRRDPLRRELPVLRALFDQ
ncbi:Uncharacterised protein [Halioglobus japonicus]|nr:Uncharacterised protein [Halioglobus japonicus]